MYYKTVLTIAGSDGSGGAGIQADLKTIAALECYGTSVITTVTAQNTLGVMGSFALPISSIREQIKAIFDDIAIDAVKIGMLGNTGVIREVAEILQRFDQPVILDTVLRSSSGRELLESAAIPVMIEELFPVADLITPNIMESAILTGKKKYPSTREEIEQTALELRQIGARSVLVKGGHMEENDCSDCLLHHNQFIWFRAERISSCNTHGTGCTLSSAIAACMAHGMSMESAVETAKAYTYEAIKAGAEYRLGKGCGPLHHFYRFW
jgi:hydroxymethylpyrimidine/phosphomethylpyrimidine kinase